MSHDDYKEVPSRKVLFQYGRYRVCRNASNIYSCWYSGNILKIGRRSEAMERFKNSIDALKGMTA